jgi:hypothetical protein
MDEMLQKNIRALVEDFYMCSEISSFPTWIDLLDTD